MLIAGLQKNTVIDYPGKMACTVFTLGCNFRCGFCHNAELVEPRPGQTSLIAEKDFFDFLETQKDFLDGVCITGGEPTLQKDLPEFLSKIKGGGFAVKLDTNGSDPELLEKLIDEKLVDYVAMDIKAPIEKYKNICGEVVEEEKIKKSVELIKNKAKDYEFRTTLIPEFHKLEDILKMAEWLKGSKKYFLQQFKPTKTLRANFLNIKPYQEGEIESFREAIKDNFEECGVRML